MTTKRILSNQRILLVDDDQSIRVSLTYYFHNKVNTFTALESAEQALERLQTEVYDVILCDYRLPGMDGLSFFQELQHLDLPVSKVLITAHGDLDLAITAIKTGIQDFILKPFHAHTVEQSLLNLLGKTPKQTPAPLMDDKALGKGQQHPGEKHEVALRAIVHKINNILQRIAGNVDMGIMEVKNESQVMKRFNNIICSVEGLMKLTSDLTHLLEPKESKPQINAVTNLVDLCIDKYSDILKREGT